jgi:hypothetical protein
VVSREGRPGGRVAGKWERRRWRRTDHPTRRQEDAVVAADDDRLLHEPLLLLSPAAAASNLMIRKKLLAELPQLETPLSKFGHQAILSRYVKGNGK